MKRFLPSLLLSCSVLMTSAAEPRNVSGIYPSLATFNEEGECGTGAVVPWADRLWVISYAPHKPEGSSDKLYEITPGLEQIIRPESVGGTPANRMIHRESGQLFIGPYVIGKDRSVRVITPKQMFGRLTGMARHLVDPVGKICYATMEEGIYEVDVKTLAVTELWADEQRMEGRHSALPGYHGKGFYSGQGRYVYSNNGDHAKEALSNPTVPSGVLAEWNGKAETWTVVRRNQFTDITGPGGIEGNATAEDPLWSVGWDHRSVILMLLDHGNWHTFRLPKASNCYDGAHGWNTEWPRIRDIGEDALLMTMHGSFWNFPRTFSMANSAGLTPRSTYLKVIGDFCRWNDRVVMGCDDAAKSEFLNKDAVKGNLAGPGQSQSNLWFVKPAQLGTFGPALGRGAVWLNEAVKAATPSDAYLFSGYAKRSLLLTQDGAQPVSFTLEVDAKGDNHWKKLRDVTVPAHGTVWTEFATAETGAWVRLIASRDTEKVTAFFHYQAADPRAAQAAPMFAGLALPSDPSATGGTLLTTGGGAKTLHFLSHNATGSLGCYELDKELRLRPVPSPQAAVDMAENAAIPAPVMIRDAASMLYVESPTKRWRLPKSEVALAENAPLGVTRVCREVCTERNLFNIDGTFYESPAQNAGGFIKIRPVTTHNRSIHDYASYRGLLVLSGLSAQAEGEHIVRSEDGKCALWVGAVDDLWQLGKPRGKGGPWQDSAVKADIPSDAYLATGYDHKRLTLSHTDAESLSVRVEADFTGTGTWSEVCTLAVPSGKPLEYRFPDAFGAYWLRVVANKDTTATATFLYD